MSEKFRGLSNKEIQLRIAQLSVEINERSSEINELIWLINHRANEALNTQSSPESTEVLDYNSLVSEFQKLWDINARWNWLNEKLQLSPGQSLIRGEFIDTDDNKTTHTFFLPPTISEEARDRWHAFFTAYHKLLRKTDPTFPEYNPLVHTPTFEEVDMKYEKMDAFTAEILWKALSEDVMRRMVKVYDDANESTRAKYLLQWFWHNIYDTKGRPDWNKLSGVRDDDGQFYFPGWLYVSGLRAGHDVLRAWFNRGGAGCDLDGADYGRLPLFADTLQS